MVAFLAQVVGVMLCAMMRDLVLRVELSLAVADAWVLAGEKLTA